MLGSPTVAIAGQGFQLSVSIGSPAVVTAIGQLKSAKRSGSKTKILTITNTDSPGCYDEYLPTTITAGDIDFSGIFAPDDTSQILLQSLQDARSLNAFKLALPTSGSPAVAAGHWAFNAYVTELASDVEFDKEVGFSGKLTITGTVVYTPNS